MIFSFAKNNEYIDYYNKMIENKYLSKIVNF